MKEGKTLYIFLILFHIILGIVIYSIPFLSKLYAFLIIVLGFIWIAKNKNRNNEVLYVCGYLVGSEVFLRMTHGSPNYEFTKYATMFFFMVGVYFKGFSKNAIIYWIYLLLLIPGIIVSTQTLGYDYDVRKSIMFNISGPLSLGIASLYCYRKKITLQELNNVLLSVGLPIISMTVYLILFSPTIRDVVVNTSSNFDTSGGFGPNQVATILGLGIFVFFCRVLYFSSSRILFYLNIAITLLMLFRGLVTFSRGGIITGIAMVVILLFISFIKVNANAKFKISKFLILISFGLFVTWIYTEFATGGLITKRYANQDALGRTKESQLSGREEIMRGEIDLFLENPFFGGGVGKGKEYREKTQGISAASHNEITRMLGEHGFFGILALFILIATPLILYLDNKNHVFLFSFLIFWFLTLNHAAMRTAAPSFIYALALLKVSLYEKPPLYRKQTL